MGPLTHSLCCPTSWELQDLAVCKQELAATRKQLHEAELARSTCDDYCRKLEKRLEKAGKGLLQVPSSSASRVPKQQVDEFLQQENQLLFAEAQARVCVCARA